MFLVSGYDGVEVQLNDFEHITTTSSDENPEVAWSKGANGSIPGRSIIVGKEGDVDTFIGRAHVDGIIVVGKVFPPHGCLYVPYYGKEIKITDYEVLTMRY